MKNPLYFLTIILLVHFHGFSQDTLSAIQRNIPLDYLTNIKLKRDSDYKKLLIDDLEVSKLYFSYDGSLNAYFGNEVFKSVPEEYSTEVSTIKNSGNKIVGMTKRYGKVHFIAIDKKIFKLERLESETQYKLWEINNGNENSLNFPKRIIVQKNGILMEIYHDLNDIPLLAVPLIINTKEIDNVVSNRIIVNLFIPILSFGLNVF